MDNIRDSLSKTKKKLKHLTGRKRKPERTGANHGGEGAGSTTSLPQPKPHIIADKSHNQESDVADAADEAEERAFPADRPFQPDGPESVPARGSGNGQEGGEAGVDGGEPSQTHSHPHPDIKVAVGSGRSGELEGVHPSPPTPSTSHAGEPNST